MFGGGLGNAGTLDLSDLDGSYGFVMNAIAEGHGSDRKASSAADVNGDDVAVPIIVALGSKPQWHRLCRAEPCGVFGGEGAGAVGTIELSELDGSDGFVMNAVVT